MADSKELHDLPEPAESSSAPLEGAAAGSSNAPSNANGAASGENIFQDPGDSDSESPSVNSHSELSGAEDEEDSSDASFSVDSSDEQDEDLNAAGASGGLYQSDNTAGSSGGHQAAGGALTSGEPHSVAGSSVATKKGFGHSKLLSELDSTSPFSCSDWEQTTMTPLCLSRIKREISELITKPLPGVFVAPEENDFSKIYALIVGNELTPYEGGFFLFYFRFGPKYPFEPPRGAILTSRKFSSDVRFHPNMYSSGHLCLSVLNTWPGPRWQASCTLASVLLTLQSLFTERSLTHEPGYEEKWNRSSSIENYDVFVRHETLRVAVLEVLSRAAQYGIHAELVKTIEKLFLIHYDSYIAACEEFAPKYDGKHFFVPYRHTVFVPNFGKLKTRLVAKKTEMERKSLKCSESDVESDLDDDTDCVKSSPASATIS